MKGLERVAKRETSNEQIKFILIMLYLVNKNLYFNKQTLKYFFKRVVS